MYWIKSVISKFEKANIKNTKIHFINNSKKLRGIFDDFHCLKTTYSILVKAVWIHLAGTPLRKA